MLSYDLLVIGGGINGTGIARDASGRGLLVLLCEKDDLAAHTSSASTKLIHGGLRYLENYEFAMVRKALIEREILLKSAPHIIKPLRFIMPHVKALRPMWLIRCGLFLYDNLARRQRLLSSEAIDFTNHISGTSLKKIYKKGFAYSDCWVQAARLVLLNAMDAKQHGATIRTHTTFVSATKTKIDNTPVWLCRLLNEKGEYEQLSAKALVNAAGPWVQTLLENQLEIKSQKPLRLVKGSHIIVKKLFDHDFAYILQTHDNRIVFALPYENDFTLIGTTDVEYHENPGKVAISEQEINYLCGVVNNYFQKQISPADVLFTYSGIRPLLDDKTNKASAISRDYSLVIDNDSPVLLSIFGGKITTFRKLAEEAVDKIASILNIQVTKWTDTAILPGGDINNGDLPAFIAQLKQHYEWLPISLLERWAGSYGTMISVLIDKATCLEQLGQEILSNLYEAELNYLVKHEWATCSDDILWRRTKLGLHLPKNAASVIDNWLKARQHA